MKTIVFSNNLENIIYTLEIVTHIAHHRHK